MATLRVRNQFNEIFEIDATARPFWEHREGHEILPDPGDEPDVPAEVADSKPSKKAAPRPASDVKEQVVE